MGIYRFGEYQACWWSGYEQKKAIEQRQRVHRLYFSEGYSKTVIAKQLGVSKGLVVRWTQLPEQDLTQDARGWPKGRGRRWEARVYARIAELRKHSHALRDNALKSARLLGANPYPGSDAARLKEFQRKMIYHSTADWDDRTREEVAGKAPPKMKEWLERVRGY